MQENAVFNGNSPAQRQIDLLHKVIEANLMKGFERKTFDVQHVFTPGLYLREIFMPATSRVISKIHKTEHPFFVLQGKAEVYTEEGGVEVIEAPYVGITKPGTRRVLRILEDCVWITAHATRIQPENESSEAIEKAVSQIEEQIIQKYDPVLTAEEQKQLETLKQIQE